MAFALHKSEEKKPQKRSPLAGWLGKKAAADEDVLPELNVAAGVDRALKRTHIPEKKTDDKDPQNDVRDALGAIEAALYAIDRLRDTLEQACEVVLSAKDIDDPGGRALLAERYDELRLSVDSALNNVDPRAAVLIGTGQRHFDVSLGGKARYSISPARLDTSERGLCLTPPGEAFATDEEIDRILRELDTALNRADRAGAAYCRDAQYLIARMNGAFE